MQKRWLSIKRRLDAEVLARNRDGEVCYERPDPVLVARRYRDTWVALVCALFGYGRADAIVAFLDRFDFALLDAEETEIRQALEGYYYRFQTGEDIAQFFITLRRLRRSDTLECIFRSGYDREGRVVDGVNALIAALHEVNAYRSRGYGFLIGKETDRTKGASPFKRWMMFLRWMVRNDAVDMGLWQGVAAKDLIIPLDTHTFQVSRKLGLLRRRVYDLQAAIDLTETLKEFDADDPLKYDFALYRLGQEKLV